MDDKTKGKSTECCVKNETQEKKMVKATELPQYGNPYPPNDVVKSESPDMLEIKLRSMRAALQPYVSPIANAFEKANDIVLVGVAHTQSTKERLTDNQSSVMKVLIISSCTMLGVALARRKGIFKKFLFGSIFLGGSMTACYPNEAAVRSQLLWYIAKNKLPTVAQQQYEKLSSKFKESPQRSASDGKEN